MATRTIEVRRVFGTRPASVIDSNGALVAIRPEWSIWNAPRPLGGHVRWIGEFQCGIWYAALDESDEQFAPRYLKGLVADDARKLEFVGPVELEAFKQEYIAEHCPEESDADWMLEQPERVWLETYHQERGIRKETIEIPDR
jgi:hypothetical protein